MKVWFDVQARAAAPNASQRDKLLGLAGIRLLRADLSHYVTATSVARYIKRQAAEQLAKKLSSIAPGGSIGPIGQAWQDAITFTLEAGLDAIAHDQIAAFLKELQVASERAASRIKVDTQIALVFPTREAGVLDLLEIGRVKAPSCSGEKPLPPSGAATTLNCEAGRPGGWNGLPSYSSWNGSPTQQTILCNACGPGGGKGAAVTVDFYCPAQGEQAWQGLTASKRRNEVDRTPSKVVTRESRNAGSYCGGGSVVEKVFLRIDAGTIATITAIHDGSFAATSLESWARTISTTHAVRPKMSCN